MAAEVPTNGKVKPETRQEIITVLRILDGLRRKLKELLDQ